MSLPTPVQSIRILQRQLYVKAKKEPRYRFYTLYDKVWRWAMLQDAYRRVRANAGAPGVDGVTFEQSEARGAEEFLRAIQRDLREGTYRPEPVRQVEIPKPDGKSKRPLGIPTIRDRVIQEAVLLVVTPIVEADLPDNLWGYRPRRSAIGAVKQVHKYLRAGYTEVVDADLRQYLELIPHAELMRCVARRVSDGKVLALIKAWLRAPVVVRDDRGRERRRGGRDHQRGTPQGGVISPLLANLYMRRFVLAWRRWERQLNAQVCNYADAFVILCKGTAETALVVTRDLMKRLKLELNEEKTRLVDARAEHCDFLGYTFGPQYDPRDGTCYPGVVPSQARIRRLREAVRSHLRPQNQPVEEVIAHLNRLLAGWARYFSYGTVSRTHRMVDCYVADRLRQFLVRRHKLDGLGTRQFPERRLYQEYGLLRLESSRAW